MHILCQRVSAGIFCGLTKGLAINVSSITRENLSKNVLIVP